MAATSCIVRSQRDKFIIALMRVRRGFLPQPPQGAPWRLAAIREDDIAIGRARKDGRQEEATENGPFWYGLVNLRRITPEGSIAIVQGLLRESIIIN